jgi:hypothetical protein
MPTICKVLPLYKLLEEHLRCAKEDLELEDDPYGLACAVNTGLKKLETSSGI